MFCYGFKTETLIQAFHKLLIAFEKRVLKKSLKLERTSNSKLVTTGCCTMLMATQVFNEWTIREYTNENSSNSIQIIFQPSTIALSINGNLTIVSIVFLIFFKLWKSLIREISAFELMGLFLESIWFCKDTGQNLFAKYATVWFERCPPTWNRLIWLVLNRFIYGCGIFATPRCTPPLWCRNI